MRQLQWAVICARGLVVIVLQSTLGKLKSPPMMIVPEVVRATLLTVCPKSSRELRSALGGL